MFVVTINNGHVDDGVIMYKGKVVADYGPTFQGYGIANDEAKLMMQIYFHMKPGGKIQIFL